ncbi:MAG: hypothetical protein CL463_06575 [Acidimicrobiaceae bacterium]|nr:hypothetical protein [Acidimicrobiaceae bacterium]
MELVHRVYWETELQGISQCVRQALLQMGWNKLDEGHSLTHETLSVTQFSWNLDEFDVLTRVVNDRTGQYVWIDVEANSHEKLGMAVEFVGELSTKIISNTKSENYFSALSGYHLLTELPDLNWQKIADENIEILFKVPREIGLIIVCYDPLDQDINFGRMEIAKRLLKDFGSLARIVYFWASPPDEFPHIPKPLTYFEGRVGRSLSLQPGEIRVFPPNEIEMGSVIAPPSIEAKDIRNNDYVWVRKQVFRILQPYLLARTLPQSCMKALRLLRESQDEIANDPASPSETSTTALEKEVEGLRTELLEKSREIEEYRNENLYLQDELIRKDQQLHDELIRKDQQRRDGEEFLVGELNKLEAELEARTAMAIRHNLSRSIRGASSDHSREIRSVSEAIEKAEKYLNNYLEIPENVSLQLDKMDQTDRSESWGKSIFKAFLALSSYAQDGSGGNFYDWNAKGLEFAIPKGDIAMTESENVRQRQYLREQRMLPVAIELDPSGKIFMEAHIKFRGNLSPRLYFFDDTGPEARTGKIHIGGIDPHSRWENTTT